MHSPLDVPTQEAELKLIYTLPEEINIKSIKSVTWNRQKNGSMEVVASTKRQVDVDNRYGAITLESPALVIASPDRNFEGKYTCHVFTGKKEMIASLEIGTLSYI